MLVSNRGNDEHAFFEKKNNAKRYIKAPLIKLFGKKNLFNIMPLVKNKAFFIKPASISLLKSLKIKNLGT